ncbi:MAG: PPC domain-containing protein [Pirellulaceae bacterium]|nr:PPC domain-containing protein [Pirellulaceae bacterium]
MPWPQVSPRVPLATCLLIVALVALPRSPAVAQQAPEVGYVYPPVVPVGTTVEVRLGGYDWTPDTQFFVHDQRIGFELLGPPGEMLHPGPPHWFGPKASNRPYGVPREVSVRLTLPADFPPGLVPWQVANANGASSLSYFRAGAGAQVLEDDLASESRQLPSLPCTLAGRLEKIEEVDRFELLASRTGPVTCTIETGRFGVPFHPVLRVYDTGRRLIADAADTEGEGLSLTFEAEAGGRYTLELFDVDYRGNRAHVYRLLAHEGPHLLAAVPPAGAPGSTAPVRFIGYGVASGSARLESVVREVTFPREAIENRFAFTLDTPHGPAEPCWLELSQIPQQLEPAETPADAPPLQPPLAICGTLDEPRQVDQYVFQASRDEAWSIHVDAQRIGSPLDISLSVLDADGKQLTTADDTAGTRDPSVVFRAPQDGQYRVRIRDLAGHAGRLDAVYRLRIEPPRAGFSLQAGDRLGVPLAGEAALVVKAERQGGFTEAISLQVSGLPPGVHVPETIEIPAGKDQVKIPLTCDADAGTLAARATITGQAQAGEQETIAAESRLLVAPVMKPRAVVAPLYKDAGRTVHRGATYAAPVVIERLEGYAGPVLLQLAAHPDRIRQGIMGQDLVVPPEVTQIEFPLFLPEWVQIDRTSRIILNTIVQVPDPKGNVRHLVNKMDTRITMNVEGALLKLTAEQSELEVRPGQEVLVPLVVSRSPKLVGDATIELLVDAARPGIQAEAVTLPAGEERAVLRIRCPQTLDGDEQQVTIQATVWPDPRLPVVSRTEVILILRR